MPPQTNDPQHLPPEQDKTEEAVPPVSSTPTSPEPVQPSSVQPVQTNEIPIVAAPLQPSEPVPSASSGVVVSIHDTQSPGHPTFSAPSAKPKRKFPVKLVLIIVAIIIVLGGGSAAAFYGYYIPHQPESVLLNAVANSAQEKQVSFSGSLNIDPTTPRGIAFKASYNGSGNLSTKDADMQLTLTASGLSFPIEARLVDQNLYIKFGDLSSLDSYISGLSALDSSDSQVITGVLDAVSQDLSNQWIEVDSTVLKEGGATCALDTNLSVTNADVKLLKQQYMKNRFLKVEDTASDTVNGRAAEKYDVSLNDDKVAAYVTSLNQLSAVKALSSCDGSKSSSLNAHSLADNSNTPATVWVDKQTHRVVKISSQSTAQDEQKDHEDASGSATLSYGNVSVTAPTGAKSFTEVLSEIEQSIAANPNLAPLLDLLNSGSSSASSALGQSL